MPNYKIIIIGSGFGGVCSAIKLQKKGIDDFIILERRSFMGGTWVQNSYLGAAVDVQSPLYSIEEEPYDWSQMFAEQSELEEYTNHVIDKHKLREKTKLNSNVTKIQWDIKSKQWLVHIEGEQEPYIGQFVINASGPLSTPVVPEFKGKDSFEGKSFHTNDWDHSFDHKNKKVAIIGSGASAAQIIPELAKDTAEFHIFQRTPHWVLPRPDFVFPSFVRKLLKNKFIYKLIRGIIYWGLETRVIGFKYSRFLLNLIAQKKAVRHIKRQIKDPELREKLTPKFTIGCKRIILSNTLYPAIQKEHVHLHDENDGIQQINKTGILTQKNKQIDVDLIVYSTGYDATDGIISYPVLGRDQKLSEVWEDYPRAYLGTTIPNFPNLFIVTGPNTGIGHTSALFLIQAQIKYILNCIQEVIVNNKESIEPTIKAEDEYTKKIHSEMDKTVWKNGGCNSWYKSKTGHVIAMFPGFSFTFARWAKKLRQSDHKLS